eukprot:1159946-Pelagomonas_calceolata.AAC.4
MKERCKAVAVLSGPPSATVRPWLCSRPLWHFVQSPVQNLQVYGQSLHCMCRAFIGNHEALALFKACSLNLSSCYLNLKQYSSCVVQCDEVLEGQCTATAALARYLLSHVFAIASRAHGVSLTVCGGNSLAPPIPGPSTE